jgi:GMP synthase-like glutamine amidotransferase
VSLLVIQHQDTAGLGRLTFPGLAVDVVRPDRGEVVPDRLDAEHAGLVVLGGAMAAWEDDRASWLPATRALLARCVTDAVPVLGICLGAQLLALATGGRVERGAAGPELGVVPIEAMPDAAADPLLSGLGDRWLGPQGHYDAVTELPPGAVHLARSQLYPHQVYRLGECAWGLQYHPEVRPADFDTWLGGVDPALLAERGTSREQLMAAFTEAEGTLAELAAALGRAFAAVVHDRRLAVAGA